jgi:hypothetical protein
VEFARLTKTPYQNLMLDKKVLRIEERLVGHKPFLPREVVQHEIWTKCLYGLRFLKTSMVIDNDFHEKRCNQLLTQIIECNILFSYDLWF